MGDGGSNVAHWRHVADVTGAELADLRPLERALGVWSAQALLLPAERALMARHVDDPAAPCTLELFVSSTVPNEVLSTLLTCLWMAARAQRPGRAPAKVLRARSGDDVPWERASGDPSVLQMWLLDDNNGRQEVTDADTVPALVHNVVRWRQRRVPDTALLDELRPAAHLYVYKHALKAYAAAQ